MEYPNIDKEIYHLPEMGKRMKSMLWAWICVAIAAVACYFYVSGFFSESVNSLMLGLVAVGVFALVTMLCYYTFGDSRRPFHKPSKRLLERTYFFYSPREQQNLLDAVADDDGNSWLKIKRSATPELVLVRYSDDAEEIAYMQVQEFRDGVKVPISPISTFQK
ncbi:MAG: hypothetical protein KBT45_04040 [Bacteroidales bacterium]|nr:hypothetical protein [Candidatus Colimorpha pelethequi]